MKSQVLSGRGFGLAPRGIGPEGNVRLAHEEASAQEADMLHAYIALCARQLFSH